MRETGRRLLWFVGLGVASLLVCASAAFVFREVIFFVLELGLLSEHTPLSRSAPTQSFQSHRDLPESIITTAASGRFRTLPNAIIHPSFFHHNGKRFAYCFVASNAPTT